MKNAFLTAAITCVALLTGCATTPSAPPEGEKQERMIAPDQQTSSTGVRIAEGPMTITRVEWAPSANIESAELRLFSSADPNCPLPPENVWAKLRMGEPFSGSQAVGSGEFLCAYQTTRDQNGTLSWWVKTEGATTAPAVQ